MLLLQEFHLCILLHGIPKIWCWWNIRGALGAPSLRYPSLYLGYLNSQSKQVGSSRYCFVSAGNGIFNYYVGWWPSQCREGAWIVQTHLKDGETFTHILARWKEYFQRKWKIICLGWFLLFLGVAEEHKAWNCLPLQSASVFEKTFLRPHVKHLLAVFTVMHRLVVGALYSKRCRRK